MEAPAPLPEGVPSTTPADGMPNWPGQSGSSGMGSTLLASTVARAFSGCQWAFSGRLVGGLLGAMEANAVRLAGPVGYSRKSHCAIR